MASARALKLKLVRKTWNNLDLSVRKTLKQTLDQALKANKLSVFVAVPFCLSTERGPLDQFIKKSLEELNAIVRSILDKGPNVDFIIFYEPKNSVVLNRWEEIVILWKSENPDEPLSKVPAEKLMDINKWRSMPAWLKTKAACDKLFKEHRKEVTEAIAEDRKKYKKRVADANDELVDEHVYHCAIDYASWYTQKDIPLTQRVHALMYKDSLSALMKFISNHAEALDCKPNSLIKLKNKSKPRFEEYDVAKNLVGDMPCSTRLSNDLFYHMSEWEKLSDAIANLAVTMWKLHMFKEKIITKILRLIAEIRIDENMSKQLALLFLARFAACFIRATKDTNFDIEIIAKIIIEFIKLCDQTGVKYCKTEKELRWKNMAITMANHFIALIKAGVSEKEIAEEIWNSVININFEENFVTDQLSAELFGDQFSADFFKNVLKSEVDFGPAISKILLEIEFRVNQYLSNMVAQKASTHFELTATCIGRLGFFSQLLEFNSLVESHSPNFKLFKS